MAYRNFDELMDTIKSNKQKLSCAVVCAVTQEGSTGGFCEMNDKGPYCGCRHDPDPAPTGWDASQ